MALKITADCTCCDACLHECPNNAISEGDEKYFIDPNKCTECVGFYDVTQCADVCPVECCVADENYPEKENKLFEKVKILHQNKTFPDDFPSHFKLK